MNARVEKLADKTLALSTQDKLLLAAGLVAHGKPDLAEVIAERAVQELQRLRLFGKPT